MAIIPSILTVCGVYLLIFRNIYSGCMDNGGMTVTFFIYSGTFNCKDRRRLSQVSPTSFNLTGYSSYKYELKNIIRL